MQITKIVVLLSLAPSCRPCRRANRRGLKQRYVGGPASTASQTVRDADATAIRQRSPKKNKAKEPLIKASKGQSQAEQGKITAQLDAENIPQPSARAGRVLGGLRS